MGACSDRELAGAGLSDPDGSLPTWDIRWFYGTARRASRLLQHETINIFLHLALPRRILTLDIAALWHSGVAFPSSGNPRSTGSFF